MICSSTFKAYERIFAFLHSHSALVHFTAGQVSRRLYKLTRVAATRSILIAGKSERKRKQQSQSQPPTVQHHEWGLTVSNGTAAKCTVDDLELQTAIILMANIMYSKLVQYSGETEVWAMNYLSHDQWNISMVFEGEIWETHFWWLPTHYY